MWYDDLCKGDYVYIRYFENLIALAAGRSPESCTLSGYCTAQLVIEADGSAYPCDFYTTDEWKIGSLLDGTLDDIISNPITKHFIESSLTGRGECKKCEYYALCKGGCRRDRDYNGKLGENYYCISYKEFFEYSKDKIFEIVRKYVR